MTARWYTEGVYDAQSFCPNAAHLSDQEYVCGMLRLVISTCRNADTTDLMALVLRAECGQPLTAATPVSWGIARLAATARSILSGVAYDSDYRSMAVVLDALLAEHSAPDGHAWVRAVSSLVDPAA